MRGPAELPVGQCMHGWLPGAQQQGQLVPGEGGFSLQLSAAVSARRRTAQDVTLLTPEDFKVLHDWLFSKPGLRLASLWRMKGNTMNSLQPHPALGNCPRPLGDRCSSSPRTHT